MNKCAGVSSFSLVLFLNSLAPQWCAYNLLSNWRSSQFTSNCTHTVTSCTSEGLGSFPLRPPPVDVLVSSMQNNWQQITQEKKDLNLGGANLWQLLTTSSNPDQLWFEWFMIPTAEQCFTRGWILKGTREIYDFYQILIGNWGATLTGLWPSYTYPRRWLNTFRVRSSYIWYRNVPSQYQCCCVCDWNIYSWSCICPFRKLYINYPLTQL